jgi:cytoskeletal protein RodZ
MAEMERDSTEDRTSLGLARRRRKKALSLEQIAQTTKIGVRSLQAIESEEFKKLPGGIYSTSYIRQYAQAIEFDEAQILALYHSVIGITPELDQAQQKPSDSEGNVISRFLRHTSAVLGSST